VYRGEVPRIQFTKHGPQGRPNSRQGHAFFQLPLADCPRSVNRSSSRSPHIPTPVRKLGTIAALTRHSKYSRFFVRRFTKLLAPTSSTASICRRHS
jgi:hypothetical protein